jgi:hypothetical protein
VICHEIVIGRYRVEMTPWVFMLSMFYLASLMLR